MTVLKDEMSSLSEVMAAIRELEIAQRYVDDEGVGWYFGVCFYSGIAVTTCHVQVPGRFKHFEPLFV